MSSLYTCNGAYCWILDLAKRNQHQTSIRNTRHLWYIYGRLVHAIRDKHTTVVSVHIFGAVTRICTDLRNILKSSQYGFTLHEHQYVHIHTYKKRRT